MQCQCEDIECKLIDYLQAIMAVQSRQKKEREERKESLATVIINFVKKIQRRFASHQKKRKQELEVLSPIYNPSNFFSSLKHAKLEMQDLKFYASEVCKIAKYQETPLKNCESYFQLKLKGHSGRLEALLNVWRTFVLTIILFIMLVFVDNSWFPGQKTFTILGGLIAVALGLTTIVDVASKPYLQETQLNSSLAYEYCVSILKIAQELLQNRKKTPDEELESKDANSISLNSFFENIDKLPSDPEQPNLQEISDIVNEVRRGIKADQ